MPVRQTARFLDELGEILLFIAEDNLDAALLFQGDLELKLQTLPLFPYRCRQSHKSNDPQVRDLIFRGYVIPYRINQTKERIEVLGIFSENAWYP
jgi:plasmid stabilization system protein ParE